MADYQFDKPVRIILGTVTHVVTNTRKASDLLMYRWPVDDGKKLRTARHALLIAMGSSHDTRLIKQARKAFADAASEIDVLLPE